MRIVETPSVIVRVNCECPTASLPSHGAIEVVQSYILVILPGSQHEAEVCVTTIPPDAKHVAMSVHQRRRNKYLEEVLNLSNELTDTKAERDKMKGNLQNINAEIDRYRDEIKNKEQLLAEKLEENKRFITLLHKAELEERAEDVVTAIKQASEGKHRMSSSDWQRFYHAVDELQPDLMERIAQHLGKFTEQQQQVCYLLSIGLTNTQIENLTDIPHVTVWRWVKKHHGHHPRGHPLNKVQDFAEWAEVGNAKSPPACSARLCRFACKEHPQRLEV